jgi:hypothetical protein
MSREAGKRIKRPRFMHAANASTNRSGESMKTLASPLAAAIFSTSRELIRSVKAFTFRKSSCFKWFVAALNATSAVHFNRSFFARAKRLFHSSFASIETMKVNHQRRLDNTAPPNNAKPTTRKNG